MWWLVATLGDAFAAINNDGTRASVLALVRSLGAPVPRDRPAYEKRPAAKDRPLSELCRVKLMVMLGQRLDLVLVE
jgi:hypothetical protein